MIRTLFLCGVFCLTAGTVMGQQGEPWKRHTIDDTSRGADGVRLGDVDQDGLLDVVTGWEEGGVVRVYRNPGPAKAKAPWQQVTVGKVASPEDAVFADLDNNGTLDVVSSCEGGNRAIYFHWAPKAKDAYFDESKWTTAKLPSSQGRSWMFCLPMQIDGQHGVDLVVAAKGRDAQVGWYQSPEDPRDLDGWKFHPLYDAGWIMSLQAHDLDNDGDLDVLLSDRKGAQRGIKWLANPGPLAARSGERWQSVPVGGHDREVMFLTATREKGQSWLVACAVKGGPLTTYSQVVVEGKPTWRQSEVQFPAGCGTGKGVAVCDVNLDGLRDLVFTCEGADKNRSGARWLSAKSPVWRPKEVWQDHEISGPVGIKYDRIEMLDLDGDGDLDLMTCEERAGLGVFWYENPTK